MDTADRRGRQAPPKLSDEGRPGTQRQPGHWAHTGVPPSSKCQPSPSATLRVFPYSHCLMRSSPLGLLFHPQLFCKKQRVKLFTNLKVSARPGHLLSKPLGEVQGAVCPRRPLQLGVSSLGGAVGSGAEIRRGSHPLMPCGSSCSAKPSLEVPAHSPLLGTG